jgi:hypothetical protein
MFKLRSTQIFKSRTLFTSEWPNVNTNTQTTLTHGFDAQLELYSAWLGDSLVEAYSSGHAVDLLRYRSSGSFEEML